MEQNHANILAQILVFVLLLKFGTNFSMSRLNLLVYMNIKQKITTSEYSLSTSKIKLRNTISLVQKHILQSMSKKIKNHKKVRIW